jgi:restriction system protein
MLLDWLENRARRDADAPTRDQTRQGWLWTCAPYQEDAPAIRTIAELEGAFEHLEYAVFRRYQNQLTRSERTRLDNSIDNALFKVERFVNRLDASQRDTHEARRLAILDQVRQAREHVERLRVQARRADLKLKELASLNAETFEEFVAEVFEALGFEVDRVGGSGDEGADLRVRRGPLLGVVQCKYSQGKSVVGSAELQKFLGTIHHTGSHHGYFVTTRTFSLAAEKFVADHPIELIDGPRLVELVQQALGPGARRDPEPAWF